MPHPHLCHSRHPTLRLNRIRRAGPRLGGGLLACLFAGLAHGQAPTWPPLYEGQPKASFHASARIMASAGQQDVTLHFGFLGLQSLTTDQLRARVSPLVDRLEAAQALRVHRAQHLQYEVRMLGAVLFMVSVSPDVVLAVPDVLPDTYAGLSDVDYVSQPSLKGLRGRLNLAATRSTDECRGEGVNQVCDLRAGLPRRDNSVLLTRLVLDRPGTWLVSAEGAQALPADGRFTVAGRRFQLQRVAAEPGLLQVLPLE